MDGEFPTAAGVARSECEKQDWLVASPTRAEFVDKHGIRSESRDDGIGLYHVGASRPTSIPSLSDDMGGGSISRILAMTLAWFFPSNAFLPVAIS